MWGNMNSSAVKLEQMAQKMATQVLDSLRLEAYFTSEWPLTVTPDAEMTCTDASPAATATHIFPMFAQAYGNVFESAQTFSGSSSEWATALGDFARQEISPVIADMARYSFEGGAGFGGGSGLSVQCNGKIKFSWGLGFGGGAAHSAGGYSGGFGGGGGAQYFDTMTKASGDFGGGAGCQILPGTNCGHNGDAGASSKSFEQITQTVAEQLYELDCFEQMQICGGGGGGGGTVGAVGREQCSWGAGFGFTWAAKVRGELQPCIENQQSGPGNPGGAAHSCSSKCSSKANFNACFCPCFKAAVTAAGGSWGKAITCYA